MQPKFTLKKFGYSGFKAIALTLVLALFAQVSFSQEKQMHAAKPTPQQKAARERAKLQIAAGVYPAVNPKADNDAGLASRPRTNTQRIEAVCATFTGALGTGDLTMPSRLNRGGPQAGNCTTPYVTASPFGNAAYYYDVHTYTNTTGLTQCGTFTLTTTDVTNANIEFGVWNNSFDPNNLATNHMADPGVSTGTPATVLSIQVTINAGQTIAIPVWSANPNSAASGTASDYTVTIDFPLCTSSACTGTPTPGNTLSTAATACAGTNFTLSLQNPTSGSGVTYQWQDSIAGAPSWNDIAGATNATLVRNHTATTFYRCKVTCGGNTGISAPLEVALTPPSGCYCIPAASDCTDNDVITRVRISTLDNASACSAGPPAGYSNYTQTVAAPIIYSGANNPITVNVPTVYTEQVAVWIDYNQNGTFEASEYTNLGSNVGNGGVITGNIAIPAGISGITTRMRVRVRFSTAWTSGLPCSTVTFGETEDYNVTIQPCVPVTVTSQPVNASVTCGGNTTFSVGTAGSIPAYGWEWRPNSSSAWQLVTNGGIYSGATTSTLTLSNVLANYNGYQYRALVTGGCSAVDFSNLATLTVNAIQPAVSPTSASICLNSVQQISLTSTLSDAVVLSEGFNTVSPLPAGWAAQNLSAPLGPTGWFQGSTTVFNSHSGAADSYIAANWQNTTTTGSGTISNWLFTPQQSIKNGDRFSFWTRGTGSQWPDRMEVRLSTNGASVNAGATETSVGDFTTLLLTINPNLTTTGYPSVWTQYTVTVSGLASPVSGRFAFRYFVTDGGGNANNSDYIGIDDVVFTSVGATAQGFWSGPTGTIYTDAAATVAYTTGSPASTVYVKPTATGVNNYTVYFNTLNPCTSAVRTIPVTVSAPITATTVTPATRAVCVGGSTTFSAAVTGGTNTTYQWQRSTDAGLTWSSISGATSSTLTLSNVTTSMTGYRYRVVATSGACTSFTSTNFGALTVNALPNVTLATSTANIVPGITSTLNASSSPAAAATNSWSWTLNGSAITGNTSTQTVDIDGLGTYQATVTDVNGCVNKSNELVIGAEASDKLWIYPNPTPGAFQVRLYFAGNTAERRKVSIYDASGRFITSKTFDLNYRSVPYMSMTFDLSGMARGTYVVKVANEYSGRVISGLVLVH